MKKYNVLVEEVNSTTVTIEAVDSRDALAIVCKLHDKGQVQVGNDNPDVNIDKDYVTRAGDDEEVTHEAIRRTY